MPNPKNASPCELLYDFSRIPDGSMAEIWVEGALGDLICTAVVKTKTASRKILHSDLFRAPGSATKAEVPLASPEKYALALFINFRKEATATLEFRIVKPPGSPGPEHHSATPIRCSITGAKDEEAPARIFVLRTLKT